MYKEIEANKRNSVILMTIFIAVIIGLGWILEKAFGDGSYSIVFIAIIISIFSVLISYFQGDKIALASTGAHSITKEENSYFYNMVENLCITIGAPMPKLYIIEDSAINAFATGRKPEISSIAVTRGALQKLNNEELEGVLAHELSHIKNYDIRFMMLVAVLVGAVAMMSNFFLRSRMWRGSDDRKNNAGPIILIAGVILAILSPLIAEIIKLAISRRREYLADASGALITRYPEGLARALEKISEDNQPLQKASGATAHLFISSPFSGKKMSSLFSTHPPIEERVKRLREMGR